VLTNVRPAALHLPGRKLVVDTSPVTQWMKTPRAKFLKQVEFLRQNSRLWGLYSAAELDWSLHSEAYKKLIFFATKPGKAIRQSIGEFNAYTKELMVKFHMSKNVAGVPDSVNSKPSSALKTVESVIAKRPAESVTANAARSTVASTSAARSTVAVADSSAARSETAKSASTVDKHVESTAAQPGRLNYQQLIVRTLGSLIAEMKTTSNDNGAQFAIVALPVRSALSVRKGMETAFNDFDFNDEVKMLQGICSEKKVDLINIHEQAKNLSAKDKDELFFLVHLTPEGHSFVAKQLKPFVEPYVRAGAKP
jgi:hypothetical protein